MLQQNSPAIDSPQWATGVGFDKPPAGSHPNALCAPESAAAGACPGGSRNGRACSGAPDTAPAADPIVAGLSASSFSRKVGARRPPSRRSRSAAARVQPWAGAVCAARPHGLEPDRLEHGGALPPHSAPCILRAASPPADAAAPPSSLLAYLRSYPQSAHTSSSRRLLPFLPP